MIPIVVSSEIVSLAFLSVLLGALMHQRLHLGITDRLFGLSVAATMFATLSDVLGYVLEGVVTSPAVLTILNIFAIGGSDIIMVPLIYYTWNMVNAKQISSRWYAHVITIGCALEFALIAVGGLTGHMFSIENGKFVAGPLYDYVGAIQILLLVYYAVFVISRRKALGNRAVFAVSSYFVLPVFAALYEWTIQNVSFVYTAVGCVMMIIYVSLQSGEIEKGQMREKLMREVMNTDVQTGLNNRRAYEKALTDMPSYSRTGVLFCDLNALKTTNDTYGHAAGDALILRFSDMLRRYWLQSEIFRISGDEFVVIKQDVDEYTFRAQTARLRQEVTANDDIAAVGCAHGESRDIMELIRSAEKGMYASKLTYYKTRGIDRRKHS